MKFLKAQQQLGHMVSDIERFIQEGHYSKDELVLICTEEERANCEAMVDIVVETVSREKLDKESDHPLEKYHLEEKDMAVHEDTIGRGGFILLAKDASTSPHRNDKDARLDSDQSGGADDSHTKEIKKTSDESDMSSAEDLTPPGFGVDFNVPQSYAETHEDVFNPEDPDPDHYRE
ncbi:hypothetical protein SAMN04488100_10165 [Alkalibacterium putridalgicola]|uniref:Heat induced stress protein YflT n=1 Tax=Alkalibacterium putridalgicola TaxID=426703 RepID=A0A1H7Q0D7_9LACT|nr:hypothetical protein [Alkalibacterium putridalgicola]GEK88100.1 hypothetical protein APU01nite_01390 [Alkalibacterium putridalgicola]SEL40965.1 hypothetical protein SAMN04488100_10165 [Alkalibacterium putridalgicola]